MARTKTAARLATGGKKKVSPCKPRDGLVKALWAESPCANYATGGEIDPAVYPMPTSIRVDGAGDFSLPLSHDDFLKLKGVSAQAPYGRGEETLLDTNVRRAWQVEAAKVSCPQIPDFFSKVVLDLAVPAMTELGIDAGALGLEVRLYKLLVYEQGGHFKFHRDTEKEVGMFATMILQLPTQPGHEGGQLEIHHGKKFMTYDFSGAKSTTGYFKTVFFCDCEHKLAEVTDGLRLCLAFSLVRNNSTFMDVNVGTALGNVQKLLKGWADDSDSPYAIPLGHKYSKNSLSFAGLKGYDRVVATLVLSCESFLDVHLCMLVKQVKSNRVHDIEEEIEYATTHWITKDDKEVKEFVGTCPFEMKYILNQDGDNPFDDSHGPDEESHEPYNGNDGGDINSQYYTAGLIVWPKNQKMKVLCAIQPLQNVLNWLEEQHKQEPDKTSKYLENFMSALKESKDKRANEKLFGALLEFCVRHDFRDAAFTVMKKWALNFIAGRAGRAGHRIKSEPSAGSAISSAIRKYGWDAVYRDVVHGVLEEEDLMSDWPGLADFPKNLALNGLQEAAVCVAEQLAYREDLVDLEDNALVGLVKFFTESGLEEEAWNAVDSLSRLDAPCLAQIVKKWEATCLPHVYEILEKRLKSAGLSTSFLKDVAKLVVAMEEQGCQNSSLALAKKDFIKDGSLDELYDKLDKIDDMDAMVLLLHCQERFRDKVRSMIKLPSVFLLSQMRKAARLIDFDTMKTYFREGLSARLEEAHKPQEIRYLGPNKPRINGIDIELLDSVFWLGDEELVADVVKTDPSLMNALFAERKDRLLERAKKWSEIGKNGFRKVVEARMHYLSTGLAPKKQDEEDGEMDEENEVDETPPKRQKIIYRMERVKQDKLKECFTKTNERLRDILAFLV